MKQHLSGKRIITVMLALAVMLTSVVVTPETVSVQAAQKTKKSGKITLAKTKGMLYAGEYMVLKPKKISGVKSKKVRYQTSNRRVATVNANGVITARKKGTVKITVTSAENKKVKAVFKLTVQKKPAKVGIKLEEKKVTMYEDEIYYLYPELTGVSSKKVIVSSSNSKVLNVVCGCKVQALKKGKATITVTSAVNKKVKAVVKVTVKDGGDWIIGEGHILEDDEYIIDGKIVKLEDMLGKVEIIDGEEFVWAK